MTSTGPDRSADLDLLTEPSRQSPIAAAQWALARVRRIGLINLIVGLGVIVSRSIPIWALLLVPVVGLSLVGAGLASWWRFTFRATSESLIVMRGVLSRRSLVIPFDKVQSVTVNEDLLERIFGLVSASVDTAGAAEPEFAIRGITRSQAEALRRLASEGAGSVAKNGSMAGGPGADIWPTPPVSDEPEVLVHRSPRDLLVIGLLGNPLGGLAIVVTLLFFADDGLGAVGVELPSAEELWYRLTAASLVQAISALVVVIVGSWVVYGLRTVVADWDLSLTTDREGIGLSAGLFKRRSRSSNLSKIQAVKVASGPLLRRVGFVQLILPTIGEGDLVVSGVTESELSVVRDRLKIPFPVRLDRRISIRLAHYWLRISAYLAVPVAVVVGVADWRFLPLVLGLPVVAGVRGYLFVRWCRWDIVSEIVSRRSGWLFAQEEGMRIGKVQTALVAQTYYQRRRGLATVEISNAESVMKIPMIPVEQARALRDRLLAPHPPSQPVA